MELLLIIIILLLIYLSFNSKYIVENYDERLTNMSFEQCAKTCKVISGCFGFAFDKKNNICYPSKDTLVGKPYDSNVLFIDSYSPNNVICNKWKPIVSPQKNPPFDERRGNSIFVCKKNSIAHPQWVLESRNRLRDLGEGVRVDVVFDIDSYDVVDHQWPINKYDISNIDLLAHDRTLQGYNQVTITNVTNHNRINKSLNKNLKFNKNFASLDMINYPKSETPNGYASDFYVNNIQNLRENTLINYENAFS